ncbi:MAG: class II fructose-bisphosphate aldolase, partial [Bacilli bacterium]
VMFDGSTLPLEENIKITKEVIKLAHAHNVSIEAELGRVGGAEAGGYGDYKALYTNVEDVLYFLKECPVDALAISIGTAHGDYEKVPQLDIQRLSEINKLAQMPLVLHGGSGLSDEQFKSCIANGIAKINVFTDISNNIVAGITNLLIDEKVGYIDLIMKSKECIEDEVSKKLILFDSKGRC